MKLRVSNCISKFDRYLASASAAHARKSAAAAAASEAVLGEEDEEERAAEATRLSYLNS